IFRADGRVGGQLRALRKPNHALDHAELGTWLARAFRVHLVLLAAARPTALTGRVAAAGAAAEQQEKGETCEATNMAHGALCSRGWGGSQPWVRSSSGASALRSPDSAKGRQYVEVGPAS